jgi:hypothetical protein
MATYLTAVLKCSQDATRRLLKFLQQRGQHFSTTFTSYTWVSPIGGSALRAAVPLLLHCLFLLGIDIGSGGEAVVDRELSLVPEDWEENGEAIVNF